mmetsp:Transcript_48518/g.71940  ORF Transcript_48518/g.71940 Transcript_48518/m.71940 type:complete len:106 (+) Transcript_48518:139-456(+)
MYFPPKPSNTAADSAASACHGIHSAYPTPRLINVANKGMLPIISNSAFMRDVIRLASFSDIGSKFPFRCAILIHKEGKKERKKEKRKNTKYWILSLAFVSQHNDN